MSSSRSLESLRSSPPSPSSRCVSPFSTPPLPFELLRYELRVDWWKLSYRLGDLFSLSLSLSVSLLSTLFLASGPVIEREGRGVRFHQPCNRITLEPERTRGCLLNLISSGVINFCRRRLHERFRMSEFGRLFLRKRRGRGRGGVFEIKRGGFKKRERVV